MYPALASAKLGFSFCIGTGNEALIFATLDSSEIVLSRQPTGSGADLGSPKYFVTEATPAVSGRPKPFVTETANAGLGGHGGVQVVPPRAAVVTFAASASVSDGSRHLGAHGPGCIALASFDGSLW